MNGLYFATMAALLQGTNLTMPNMKRMGVVLFPPAPEDLAKLLDAGFRDAHRDDDSKCFLLGIHIYIQGSFWYF